MNKWFAGCDNVKLFELHKKVSQTDRQTDGQTEIAILKAAWSQLKIGHLFYATSSYFVHHFVAIGEFKLELSSGNPQFGSKSTIFLAVWPWNLTDDLEKQQDTSFKQHQALCVIWLSYMNSNWSYRPERLNWVMTFVTLTFDLWPWPFAWASFLSLVTTHENFVIMQWQEHSEKGVTDRQTDGQTDRPTEVFLQLLGRS